MTGAPPPEPLLLDELEPEELLELEDELELLEEDELLELLDDEEELPEELELDPPTGFSATAEEAVLV